MIVHPHTKFQGKIPKFRGKSDHISNFCNHFSTPYKILYYHSMQFDRKMCSAILWVIKIYEKSTEKTFPPSEEKSFAPINKVGLQVPIWKIHELHSKLVATSFQMTAPCTSTLKSQNCCFCRSRDFLSKDGAFECLTYDGMRSSGNGRHVGDDDKVRGGGGMDIQTGVFTAPAAGVYFFSFHGTKEDENPVNVCIKHNSKTVARVNDMSKTTNASPSPFPRCSRSRRWTRSRSRCTGGWTRQVTELTATFKDSKLPNTEPSFSLLHWYDVSLQNKLIYVNALTR